MARKHRERWYGHVDTFCPRRWGIRETGLTRSSSRSWWQRVIDGFVVALMLAVTALAAAAAGVAAQVPSAPPPPVLPDIERLPPDLRAIRERGYLIVATMVQDRYPFYYVNDDGEIDGLEIDIARDVARHLGVDVVFDRSPQTFNGVVDYVADGHADMGMAKLSITLPRAQQVLFTKPYISLPQTILVNRVQLASARAGSDALQVLRIPGQRIAVMDGSSFVGYGRQLFPDAVLVPYDNPDDLFQAVINGDVVATTYDKAQTSGLLHERPELLIFLDEQEIPGVMDPLAIAVPWQSQWLHQWLNTYLELRDEHWTVEQLFDMYKRPGTGG